MRSFPYINRFDAGRELAKLLTRYAGLDDLLVLALPRGGVPVAFMVAGVLGAPLDVMLVRKLGVPGQEELAMGAIATGPVRVINHDVVRMLGITPQVIDAVADRESVELSRREQEYRGERPRPQVAGKTIILIDDGLATGASMRVAVAALRQQGPARIVVAVPVAPPDTARELADEVDELVCPETPEPFFGVGQWYRNFEQTTDEEVRDLLTRATKAAR